MPRLTEQEQQEIIRFIEADKPLPDKYRFLLFEDKREVELVWNGKTNEVCNIVLPFQTIEQVDEPRAEKPSDDNMQLGLFDTRGRQRKGWTNKIELTDFSVFYSQDSISNAEQTLKNRSSRIVVEKGQVVKVSKDADGIVSREVLTKHWTDWIDYWSVDFDFESKQEIIRVQDPDTGEWQEQWTGDYVFENEWQSFRTKKDRSLELTSVAHECSPGRRKLAVKVVDIFGNDTMTIVEVLV